MTPEQLRDYLAANRASFPQSPSVLNALGGAVPDGTGLTIGAVDGLRDAADQAGQSPIDPKTIYEYLRTKAPQKVSKHIKTLGQWGNLISDAMTTGRGPDSMPMVIDQGEASVGDKLKGWGGLARDAFTGGPAPEDKFALLPKAFQDRYRENVASGQTKMTPQDAANYYNSHYNGAENPPPATEAVSPAPYLSEAERFDLLPPAFKQRYLENRRAGRTQRTLGEAADYYAANYKGTQQPKPTPGAEQMPAYEQSRFRLLPKEFQDKYLDNREAGRTSMTPEQVADYYDQHYRGAEASPAAPTSAVRFVSRQQEADPLDTILSANNTGVGTDVALMRSGLVKPQQLAQLYVNRQNADNRLQPEEDPQHKLDRIDKSPLRGRGIVASFGDATTLPAWDRQAVQHMAQPNLGTIPSLKPDELAAIYRRNAAKTLQEQMYGPAFGPNSGKLAAKYGVQETYGPGSQNEDNRNIDIADYAAHVKNSGAEMAPTYAGVKRDYRQFVANMQKDNPNLSTEDITNRFFKKDPNTGDMVYTGIDKAKFDNRAMPGEYPVADAGHMNNPNVQRNAILRRGGTERDAIMAGAVPNSGFGRMTPQQAAQARAYGRNGNIPAAMGLVNGPTGDGEYGPMQHMMDQVWGKDYADKRMAFEYAKKLKQIEADTEVKRVESQLYSHASDQLAVSYAAKLAALGDPAKGGEQYARDKAKLDAEFAASQDVLRKQHPTLFGTMTGANGPQPRFPTRGPGRNQPPQPSGTPTDDTPSNPMPESLAREKIDSLFKDGTDSQRVFSGLGFTKAPSDPRDFGRKLANVIDHLDPNSPDMAFVQEYAQAVGSIPVQGGLFTNPKRSAIHHEGQSPSLGVKLLQLFRDNPPAVAIQKFKEYRKQQDDAETRLQNNSAALGLGL